jgi:hypothetical protein
VLWRFADVRHWGALAMTKLGCHKLQVRWGFRRPSFTPCLAYTRRKRCMMLCICLQRQSAGLQGGLVSLSCVDTCSSKHKDFFLIGLTRWVSVFTHLSDLLSILQSIHHGKTAQRSFQACRHLQARLMIDFARRHY